MSLANRGPAVFAGHTVVRDGAVPRHRLHHVRAAARRAIEVEVFGTAHRCDGLDHRCKLARFLAELLQGQANVCSPLDVRATLAGSHVRSVVLTADLKVYPLEHAALRRD